MEGSFKKATEPVAATRVTDFVQRLIEACERNAATRRPHGRQTWIRRRLHEQFEDKVSPETISKWFAGKSRPAGERMRFLAELLGVDEAWLAWGPKPSSGALVSGVSEEPPATDFSVPLGVLKLQHLRDRLGGTVKVAPGVDLTDPIDESWEADA